MKKTDLIFIGMDDWDKPVCKSPNGQKSENTSDKKRIYTVPVRYVFAGEFEIKADSRKQAEEYAYKHCGLVLGGDIHSTLPEETVDWAFPIHPEKIVGRGKVKH